MKLEWEFPSFLVLMVLWGFAVVFPSPTAAQTIHALLLIDDANPSNAAQHVASKDKMERVFRHINNEAGIRFELSELKSNVDEDSPEWMSIGNIGKWILTVDVARHDIVFVYFSGHGGAHRTTGAHRTARELFLTLPAGKFDRKRLADAVDTIPCRLKILLTDTSSYGVPINRPYRDLFVFDGTPWSASSINLQKAYANLLLEHAGFLNVAAAVEGESALGNAEGGIFTRAFVDTMLLLPDTSDDDGFVSWKDIFEGPKGTKERLHSDFQVLLRSPAMPGWLKEKLTEVGQQSQRPRYFGEWPKRIRR